LEQHILCKLSGAAPKLIFREEANRLQTSDFKAVGLIITWRPYTTPYQSWSATVRQNRSLTIAVKDSGARCTVFYVRRTCVLLSVTLRTVKWLLAKQSRYTPWWRLGERRYSSYSFLTSTLDGLSGQRHVPAALCPGKRTSGGGWVGLRAGLDTEVRGKILCPYRGSNPDRPVVQSEAIIEQLFTEILFCFEYKATENY
jgi:hypothetical protein